MPHRPVCPKCKTEFVVIKTGVRVVDMQDVITGSVGQRVWYADMFQCPGCATKIVANFSGRPDGYCGLLKYPELETIEKEGAVFRNYEVPQLKEAKKETRKENPEEREARDAHSVATSAMMRIREYWLQRKLVYPDVTQAVLWAVTEVGEVAELLLVKDRQESGANWVRNNPDDEPEYSSMQLAYELGDVIMMCLVAGIAAGVNPLTAMFLKMRRKIQEDMEQEEELEEEQLLTEREREQIRRLVENQEVLEIKFRLHQEGC